MDKNRQRAQPGTSDHNLEQLSRSVLEHYVETRRRIDAEIRVIESLAHILTQLRHCEKDRIEIDPFALACIHEVIEQSLIDLREALDSFVGIGPAVHALRDETGVPVARPSNTIEAY